VSDAAFPDALPALSRLHWYVLERVLGQGGFGITYLARDTNLDQQVAIKEYLPVDVATRQQDATVRPRGEDLRERYRWGLERFIQEARTLARFDHPSIVRVLSVFEHNGTAYMVMRFEQGDTLSALLDRRGTLPEAELLQLLLPILDGLQLVHGSGFIHRDIKPDNILIRADGRPVLLDFGSARQSLGNSNTLTILIAPGYAPFEQYHSDPAAQGPWTDIYALGATCYRVICGRAPADAVTRSRGILGSTQEVMVPVGVVGAGRYSARMLTAVDHALAFAEKDRPQSIAEWRRELVGDDTVPATSTQSMPRPAAPQSTVARDPTPAPAVTAPAREAIVESRGVAQTTSPPPASKQPRAALRLGIGLVAAIAIAVLVNLWMRSGDDTPGKIAALEKQMRDNKDAADAERERKLREQAETDTAKSKAREAERAAAEQAAANAPVVAAPPAPRTQPEPSKKHDEPSVKASPPAKSSPSTGAPRTSTTSPAAPAAVPTVSGPAPKNTIDAMPNAARDAPPVVANVAPAPRDSIDAMPNAARGPSAPPAPASPEDAMAAAQRAFDAKRYAEALALYRPLADAGNAQAQIRLGEMYAGGLGVERELASAERWYEKAALQGNTTAQMRLGAMYAAGGATGNYNIAYIWYGTAALLGSSAAKAERDKVAAQLQPYERERADSVIKAKVEAMAKKQ
jgi:serine/threonine protein kinase